VGQSQITPSKRRTSQKGKERVFSSPSQTQAPDQSLSQISHKALFLSIYSKYLAGEKRKDEESEMILGPADGGVTVNKELPALTRLLGAWLEDRGTNNLNGGGWLEYLYGILLAKNKNEEMAKEWFLKSVHIYPFNWGAWQELSNLLNNADEVRWSI
jgi:anaphase-promoting complex subunit 8